MGLPSTEQTSEEPSSGLAYFEILRSSQPKNFDKVMSSEPMLPIAHRSVPLPADAAFALCLQQTAAKRGLGDWLTRATAIPALLISVRIALPRGQSVTPAWNRSLDVRYRARYAQLWNKGGKAKPIDAGRPCDDCDNRQSE